MANLVQEITEKRDAWKSDKSHRTTLYKERKLNYDGKNYPEIQAGHESITANYSYAIVEKMSSFLFGSPMSIDIKPTNPADEVEVIKAQGIEDMIREAFDRSEHKTTNHTFGKTASMLGDGFLKLLIADDKAPYFDVIEKPHNVILGFRNDNYKVYDYVVYEYQISKIRAKELYKREFAGDNRLDSLGTSVGQSYGNLNQTDPLNQLSAADRQAAIFAGEKNFVTVSEYWDEKKHCMLINDKVVLNEENKWGIIPYYHFKNIIVPGEPWGISDIEHTADIVKKFNLKLSEEADAVKQYVFKKMKTNSPSLKANEIKWDKSQLFSLLDNEDVNYLFDQTSIFPSEANLTRLMKAIQDIGFVPEGTFGGIDVSNISGRALSLLFQAVIQVITAKRNQLEYMYKNMIRDMVEIMQSEFPDFKKIMSTGESDQFDNEIEIRFGEILPEDRESIIRNVQNLRGGKTPLVSDYQAMKMAGITNPVDEAERITTEKQKEFTFNMQMQQAMEQMTKPEQQQPQPGQQPEQGFQRAESDNEAEGTPGAGIPSYSGTPGGAGVATPQGAINAGEQQAGRM